MMKVAIGIFLFTLAFAVIKLSHQGGESTNDRIEQECTRTYGNQGLEAVNRCRIDTSIRYLKDRQQEDRDAVYSRVR